ncbi:MAG: Hsp20/alpha crystallin family protein [Verrucomicrobiota bacterium]
MNLFTRNNDTQVAAPAAPRRTVAPRYDVQETADGFTVTAFLPGVDRTALETQVDSDKLTIFGRRTWTAPAEWTTIYRETQPADFRLVLEIDQRVNRDAIKAELNQGVLTLTLPKAEAVKPRRIEIQG